MLETSNNGSHFSLPVRVSNLTPISRKTGEGRFFFCEDCAMGMRLYRGIGSLRNSKHLAMTFS